MAKPIKLDPRKVLALLADQGAQQVQDYFMAITEGMRQDVTAQVEDLRSRVSRAEAIVSIMLEKYNVDQVESTMVDPVLTRDALA